jgi:uncharacterized protein YndB with AHSA1/START domain
MMIRVLKWLGILVVAAIAVFAGIVAMQPSEFRVERSTVVAAPADKVFANVNDFHNWENWSPWSKLDPNAKAEYDGAPAGEGAVFKWAGNNEVGEGSMTVTESRPAEFIRIRLDFVKPMPGTSMAEFTFKPQGDQTAVTWAMFGENTNFFAKAICMVMNGPKMVGSYFEKGLASLKAVSERGASSS